MTPLFHLILNVLLFFNVSTANYMIALRKWFSATDFEDWTAFDADLGDILATSDNDYERDLINQWHEICNPSLLFCETNIDCNVGETCRNYECLPDGNVYGYGAFCSDDSQCPGDLECCEQGECCHRSERDRYDELPCADAGDCCTDGELSACCYWGETEQYGTCCTLPQFVDEGTDCSGTTCDYRLACCPGNQFTFRDHDYCCTQAEYDFVIGDRQEPCSRNEDCFSGYCCADEACCTYGEFISQDALCFSDRDCFHTQSCCAATNTCCYQDGDSSDAGVVIVIVITVLLCLLISAVSIAVLTWFLLKGSSNQTGTRNVIYPNPVNVVQHRGLQMYPNSGYAHEVPPECGFIAPPKKAEPPQPRCPGSAEIVPAAPVYYTPPTSLPSVEQNYY